MVKLQEILARNLRRARKELQLSQMRLAELCNVSTSFIGEIETAKKFPSAKTLDKIARALGMRPYQLFVEESDQSVFERRRVLTTLSSELRERITEDVSETVRKYLDESNDRKSRRPSGKP